MVRPGEKKYIFYKDRETIEPCEYVKRGCKIGIDIVRTSPPWKELLYKYRWKNYAAERLHKGGKAKETASMKTKKLSTNTSKERGMELQSLDRLKINAQSKVLIRQEVYKKNHLTTLSSKRSELMI